MPQIQIDTEAVSTATNRINNEVSALTQAMNVFLQLLNEKVNDTKGNFSIIATLETRLQAEAANVKNLEAKTEEINVLTRKYIEAAEDANDDSAFRD